MTESSDKKTPKASESGNVGEIDSQGDENEGGANDVFEEGAELNEDAQALKDELEKITVDAPTDFR